MLHQQPCAFSGHTRSTELTVAWSAGGRLPGLIAVLAWLCTLAPMAGAAVKSAGVDAIAIDHAPVFLLSGGAPNLILTIDNSNSMNAGFLPDDIWVPGTVYTYSTPMMDPRDTAALTNPQYYNPAITYQPPPLASGNSLPQADFTAARLDPLYSAWACSSACTAATCAADCANTRCTLDLAKNYPPAWTFLAAGQVCTELTASSPKQRYSIDYSAFAAFKAANPTLTDDTAIGNAWAKHCMQAGDAGDCPAFYYRMKYNGNYGGVACSTLYLNLPKPAAFPIECLERVQVGEPADLAEIRDKTGANITQHVLADRRSILQGPTESKSDRELGQRNFANWFSYYRSRFLTVQSVVGRVMAGLPKRTRLGYQGLISGQYTKDDAAFKALSGTFGPYGADARQRFYDWLYATIASTNTFLVSADLRVHEFCKSDQAYVEQPAAVNGVLVTPVNPGTNPLRGCRNNVHLIFTDGFWEDLLADKGPGSFAPPSWLANNDGAAQALASNPRGLTSVGPQHSQQTGVPQTYSPAADYAKVYQDHNTGMLADVTFQSWIEDLRPDLGILTDAVPPIKLDPTGTLAEQFWNRRNDLADWQHVTTFTVGFGVAGNAQYPSGNWTYGTGAGSSSGNIFLNGFPGNLTATGFDDATFQWNSELLPVPDKVDDTWHAGINGRGGYLNASDPNSLVSAFGQVLTVMSTLAGDSSAAAVAVNTGSTVSDDLLYLTRMNPTDWSGDVRAYQVSNGRGNTPCPNVTVAGQPCVDASLGACVRPYCQSAAALLLQDLGGDFRKRLIFTAAAGIGIRFGSDSVDWGALTTIQKLDFLLGAGFTGNNPDDATDAQTLQAKARLDYVAGDQTYEQAGQAYSFRKRTTLLGDFINAAPVLVGVPEYYYKAPGYLDGVGSRTAYKNTARSKLLYAGANDGMLHAFSADTLSESFTFIPPVLMGLKHQASDVVRRPGLHVLSDLGYGAAHQSYVDGPIAKGDVRFGDAAAGDWHTVLIAGLGLGAQALYALDVTNPIPTTSGFGDTLFLWQFIDRDDGTTRKQSLDPDLGYVFGRPAIVRIRGATDASDPIWVAITGNGYNSAEDDGSRAAGCDDVTKDVANSGGGHANALCGQAVLYVLDSKTGEMLKKFETGVGRKDDPLYQDAASAGKRRPNGLGQPTVVATTVRAQDGDLLADYAYAADLFGNVYRFDLTGQSGHTLVRTLFSATGPNVGLTPGLAQPITSPVVVARHPTKPGNLVMFGTGQYLAVDDVSDRQVQTFYAIWDQDDDSQPPVTRGELLKQRFQQTNIVTTGTDGVEVTRGRTSSSNAIDWSTKKGWYIDLDIETENLGGTNLNKGERVAAAPEVQGWRVTFVSLVPENNPCAGAGYSWINTLDLRTGAPFPLTPLDYNLDGAFSDADLLKIDNTTTQAGTSVRFTPGGKNTGVYTRTSDFGDGKGRSTSVVSTSQGGLETIDNNMFLQWRVWQQLP